MRINLAIAQLLLRHNCVIIPSFGGFVANVRTTQIDTRKGIITPPRKVLTFNANLVNNDGLLANYIAQTENCSFDQAANVIEQTCKTWKEQLNNGNRIEIEKVGFLYLDEERNLNFEQNRFFNLLLSSFGLENIQFIAEEKKIIAASITETKSTSKITPIVTSNIEAMASFELEKNIEPVVEKENTPVVDITPKKRKKSYWKYAAAAIFIPIAFYSFWIPLRTDVLQSGVLLSGDFNPFNNVMVEKYQEHAPNLKFEAEDYTPLQVQIDALPKDVELFAYHLDEFKYLQVDLRTTNNANATQINQTVATVTLENKFNFYLIVGCFGKKANAESLVTTLSNQGFPAKIIDKHKGLYRVSVKGAESKAKSIAIKNELRAVGIESWVLSS